MFFFNKPQQVRLQLTRVWKKSVQYIIAHAFNIYARWTFMQTSSSPARHVLLPPLSSLVGLPPDRELRGQEDLSNDDDLALEILGDYFYGVSWQCRL